MATNLRRCLRLAAGTLVHYSGASQAWRGIRRGLLRRQEICVLGLHRVLAQSEAPLSQSHPGILLKEETFSRFLEYLRQGWHVLSLQEFLAQLERPGISVGQALCLLTFDDGWKDNYTTAFPALRSAGLPATIFLTTGYADAACRPWVERLLADCRSDTSVTQRIQAKLGTANLDDSIERLKRLPAARRDELLRELLPPSPAPAPRVDEMMSWDQIREMAQHGIEFGGHTVTHPLLIYEDDATVEREIRGCRQILEQKLQRKIRSFAYPNGDWDERVREAVRRAGFECAFTTEYGWHDLRSDRYTVRRIMIHERNVTGRDGRFSPAAFNLTVSGWL